MSTEVTIEYKLIVDIEHVPREDWKATVVCVRHTEETAEAGIVPRGSQLWAKAVERARRNYQVDMLITMDTPAWRREVERWWLEKSEYTT